MLNFEFKINNLKELASRAEPSSRKLFSKLKKFKPKDLDAVMQTLHDEAFAEIDCLECANCCKTTSPIFYQKDIERLSKHFRIRPSEFIEKYLHIDEDKDFVLNIAPCPFLGSDNYCSVYEGRPNACREYPHTNRKKIYQLLDLTLKNTSVCPAVYKIVEKLKDKF
jgi:Fe-S-cluster containining protein